MGKFLNNANITPLAAPKVGICDLLPSKRAQFNLRFSYDVLFDLFLYSFPLPPFFSG